MKSNIFLTLIIFSFIILSFVSAIEKKVIKREDRTETEDNLFKYKETSVDKFATPEKCGECHEDIYKQWKGSMHSKAFIDPVWRAATKLFYSESKTPGEILEMKTCVKCHTPLGFRSNLIQSPEDNYDKLTDLPAQGIFCNWCHNINEAVHIGDAGYEIATGEGENFTSTILGPRNDPRFEYPPEPKEVLHPSEYSQFYTKSEFCGMCHNVSHIENKLPLEQTYSEWENSPYNTKDPQTTVTCQDCHMRQKAGIPSTGKTEKTDSPGISAKNGPRREHIWTHYFAGGNSIVPKLLGSDLHSFLAIERLTNAAELEIIKDDSYKKGGLSKFKVKVTNSGAGHYLPTGVTAIRQMWLDVKITSRDGVEIFRSGDMDRAGDLEKSTVIYNTVLGDKNGKPVTNVALADRILYDHRIPPKGYVIEDYSFIIPESAFSPLKVEVVLKYRTISPGLMEKLLGDKAPKPILADRDKDVFPDDSAMVDDVYKADDISGIPVKVPVIDMASLTEKINF
ncbi:MAG: multiheme c-type cytochrome [bacterium]|nr:multiheme c-type cytochrome [bacterium]